MQEAGEVLLNLMRSHSAAYRALKAMPGAQVLKHACQYLPYRHAKVLASLTLFDGGLESLWTWRV